MKIGLISDTHGFLDPRLPRLFRGVDHILHAGDIGPDHLIAQLESIAPVTAVLGNTDASALYRLTETIALGGRKFFLQHIVAPHALTNELQGRLARERPDVVLFGHTHQAFNQTINGVWFLNPGYAGKPKSGAARSVALLEGDAEEMRVEFIGL
ncbi:MAG: metallophosphoesterase family protein [Verrucomicrobiota bacterium]|nr:metallophosphoesterase family protein [Verrucomicrobiota bacterium]MCC6822901.1 metallophosphoesterase family protein [Limisphaerales bacterium]